MQFPSRLISLLVPVALVALFYALSAGSTVFLWLICAFFLFALIDPWMVRLSKTRISPIFIAIGLIVFASAILAGLGLLFYRTSSGLILQLLTYKTAIFGFYEKSSEHLTHWTQSVTHVTPESSVTTQTSGSAIGAAGAAPLPTSLPEGLGGNLLSGLNSAFSILSFAALTPLLTFFMVAERNHFAEVCSRYFVERGTGRAMWKRITDGISGFFLGNLILVLFSLPIFVLLFRIIGVKGYVTLGILSAIFNLVPFLGFILAAILPTMDLLMNGGSATGALILVGCCFLTHFTVANVVTPKVIGSKLNINATASTIALIAWGDLWGPLGLLLAIPLTAIIKILFEYSHSPTLQGVAALMGEDPKSLQNTGMKLVTDRVPGLKTKA